jgi:hypothetical protein
LFQYQSVVDDRPADDDPEHGKYESGVGMVGSITFSLIGETHPGMTPEDIYALHCCWELEYRGETLVSPTRDIETGRKLLAEHQQGFAG